MQTKTILLPVLALSAITAWEGAAQARGGAKRAARAQSQTQAQPAEETAPQAAPTQPQRRVVPTTTAAELYNVVFIISDQMSARALSIYGNDNISTPNIERLAREGVQFMNSVCVVPTSSPARGSLLTGLYPMAHGVLNNVSSGVAPVDNNLPSPEKILFADGYATRWFGKWHLGEIADYPCYHSSTDIRADSRGRYAEIRRRNHPQAATPPKGYVLAEANADQGYGFYQTEYLYNLTKRLAEDQSNRHIVKDIGSIGRYGVPADLFDWTQAVDEGLDFIRANKDRPFMATISVSPPHPAFAICEPYYSMVDPARIKLSPSFGEKSKIYANDSQYIMGQYLGEQGIREKMRCYYAQCLFVDDMIGRILATLDKLDLTRKTIVVFTADHGDPLSSHGGLYGKSIDGLVEELVCTPALITLPGVIPAGKKVVAHFHSADFAPTLLDYLGQSIPSSMQGRSFRPIIEGKEKDVVGFGYTMRPAGARNIRGEIDGRMYSYSKVFVLGDNGSKTREELYDLTADPCQMKNVIDDKKFAPIKARMIAQYDAFNKRVGDQMIENLPQKGLLNYGNLKKNKQGEYIGSDD